MFLGQLAVLVVIALGMLSVACWLGAQLSAVLFGGGAMRCGLTTSGQALLSLPRNLASPSRAWPEDVRASLPGATLYWLCSSAVLLVGIAIVGAAVLVWRHIDHQQAHPLGVEANAGFARRRDLKRLIVCEPQPGRLTLGYAGRALIAAEPQVSLAVVGPTGCGKTVGFAIPALLEWRGPIVATSVKGDLINAALVHRQSRGTVWIYDPTSSSGHQGACWSPLAACGTWGGALRISAWLCDAARPRADSVSDGDYWYTQARRALAPYLYAAALGGRTIRDVVRWIDTQESKEVEGILGKQGGVDNAVAELLESERAAMRRAELQPEVFMDEVAYVREHLRTLGGGDDSWEAQDVGRWPIDQQQQLRERVNATVEKLLTAELSTEAIKRCEKEGLLDGLVAAKSLWTKEPRLRGSVFATVENVLAGYGDPGVGQAANKSDIDLDQWLDGDNTIFVVAAAHEQARLRPVLSVLVQQAIRSAYDRANERGGRLDNPCLVLLDEAGNIAPLRDLPGYASTARSHGITLVSIWQDLAQIKSIYGDRAQTVLNNHRAKLFGTGIADEATLDYVSRLIGDERRTETNLSGDLNGGRRSMSEHVAYRRAAPVDLLRRIGQNEGVLIHGRELPARVRLRPWYERVLATPSSSNSSPTRRE